MQFINLLKIVVVFTSILSVTVYAKTSTVINLPNKVILTEFYDYECPHCRHMEVTINQLAQTEACLKINYRPIPLLNLHSRFIASFALATKEQGQWQTVHNALMASSTAPSPLVAQVIIKQYHLNLKKINSAMQQPRIQKQLNHNILLAEHYAIQGRIAMPILVFQLQNQPTKTIVLRGEQPYVLLDAVIKQLNDDYVQTTQTKSNHSD